MGAAVKRPTHARRPPLWLAHDPAGLEHARSHAPAPRTACGLVAVPERFAYPGRARCPVCEAVLARVAADDREAARCRR